MLYACDSWCLYTSWWVGKTGFEPLRPSMEKVFLVGLLKSCPPRGRGCGGTSRNPVHRGNRTRMILC